MPFIQVNGCKMYYESFGIDHLHQAPIILIHGSTQTGTSCWGQAAPLLARHYKVIVPDCRGHGKSDNPHTSYSFTELAADIAGLVEALGYPRAHIIGHSNGGNVALVTLLDQPQVVQSAVIQAANAYISPDLIEKEPHIFNPERVAKEAPEWKAEMIALHGETHGEDYWRDLLRLTVDEIISEPNYSAEDLAKVKRPTYVIQGAEDRVNAPARHAQFIAQNIPDAEIWLPYNIGHNVHDEILFAWIEHIQDFLSRRGDDVNDALFRMKRRYPFDNRTTIFEPSARFIGQDHAAEVVLTGRVLTQDQNDAALEIAQGTSPFRLTNNLVTLLPKATYALIRRSVTDIRKEPSNHAERVSQALVGEVVRVFDNYNDWSWVQSEHDHYLGWLQTLSLHAIHPETIETYKKTLNAMVQVELLPAQTEDLRSISNADKSIMAGKLPFGVRVQVVEWIKDRAIIGIPSDRIWIVPAVGLLPSSKWPRADQDGIDQTLQLIRRFIGVPYLWGGRTPFGFDCSGLAQTFYQFLGLDIPRDADQQFSAGYIVDSEPRPGDLLFFGENDEPGSQRAANISHVAISLGGMDFIHSNGAAWGVSYNSFDPQSRLYNAWLFEHWTGTRRFR